MYTSGGVRLQCQSTFLNSVSIFNSVLIKISKSILHLLSKPDTQSPQIIVNERNTLYNSGSVEYNDAGREESRTNRVPSICHDGARIGGGT